MINKARNIVLLLFLFLAMFYITLPNLDRLQSLTGFVIGIFSGNDANINVDFGSNAGRIRDDFYGANTHGSWLGAGTKIDANADGIPETASDLAWHRQAWLDSGMKMMRWDANLGSYYAPPWGNKGFETRTNFDKVYFDSDADSGAVGWRVSTYGGGAGYVGPSIDSHSGNYSLNVTGLQPSHVFAYRIVNFKEGMNYNFSVWIKSNNNFKLSIQRLDDYSNCGTTNSNVTSNNWKLISVACDTFNLSNQGYRLLFDFIEPNESLIIDDVDLTENNLEYNEDYYFNGNLSTKLNQLSWADNNKIKMLLTITDMPKWLADTSVQGCNLTKLTDCTPYNYTLWSNLVSDYLNRLTANGTYSNNVEIEVWNEPDIKFFLSNLKTDDQLKASAYNALFSSIINSSNIAMGGPSLSSITSLNMTRSFLSNFSNIIEFFSIHKYDDNIYSTFYSDINKSYSLCNQYDANCSHIILSEWNTASSATKNSSQNVNQFSASTALGYAVSLDNWPSNVSMLLYQWSEQYKYSDSSHYPEYPQKWAMVSEPGLDNEYAPSYNVTKNFAHFHAGGDMVVNSSSDNVGIKVVASEKDNGQEYITIISTSSSDAAVYLNLQGTSINALQNIETGEVYNVTNGSASLGIFSQYDVKYYTNYTLNASGPSSDLIAPIITILSPTAKTYNINNIGVNATINEPGTCTYSMNAGSTNNSFTIITGNTTFKAIESGFSDGFKTVYVYCADLSGNRNSKSVSFTINTSSSSSANNQSSSSSGGGGGGASNPIIITIPDIANVQENLTKQIIQILNENNSSSSGSGSSQNNESTEIKSQNNILGRAISDFANGVKNSKLIIWIIGLALAVFVFLTINFVYKNALKRATHEATVECLQSWIGKAKAEGYSHAQMEKMLIKHGWDVHIVRKAISDVRDGSL